MFEVNELELFYEAEEENDELEKIIGASSDEALLACLNKLGRVDLLKMSRASGRTLEQLVLDLGGSAIFQDPAEFQNEEHWSIEKGWQLCSQYCCGNINRKLKIAKRMNKKFHGCFDSNIRALKKMLSTPLDLTDIHVSLGAPWVPAEIYQDFARELLNLKCTPTIIFNKELGIWQVKAPDEAKNSILNTDTYGVPREWKEYMSKKPEPYLTALDILKQTMNAKTIKVYDYVGWDNERVFNKEATLIAQQKQREIIREFDKWVQVDESRRLRLEECYNDAFVGYGVSAYDGSFLKFTGLNPKVKLRFHQRNAIAQMVLSNLNLLLAHDVGTGKTYIIVAGVHELHRMGISTKNMIVAPVNILQEIAEAHKYLYPDDKILVVSPKDFRPQNRKQTLEKIRDGDYVAIYIGYKSFDNIVMSKQYWINKMTSELNELSNAIDRTYRKEVKRVLERQKEALSKKLSKYAVEAYDPPWLTFDQLGIETLVVDEAHNYKNIPINTRADNIVGMHTKGSEKCKEMLEKSKVVKKLVLATGTPITNSLTDMFVLQTYLQPDELKFRGIDSFDMWINTFAQRETNIEEDIDGEHVRAVTRFSKFHNLTELISLFSTVCNFHTSSGDNNEALPLFQGYTNICVPKNEAQANYIKELSNRIELIRSRKVFRNEDNLLKVTTDGRKCALDIRLVDSDLELESDEQNKIMVCADNVYDLYAKYPNTCQIVFSDIGTPKTSFNVYDELKYELTLRGVPAHQIAFVHDATTEAARARLFAEINAGTVRVVVGSTSKLGVGVNIQKRLIAIHHLSVPWRPADMVQREGRGIRQGNEMDEVFIYRYTTKGTYDAYSWQLLESKQRIISSILSGTLASRNADDVSDAVLNYAEIKALSIGNPLIKKRVETYIRLERIKISCRARQKDLTTFRAMVENTPEEINRLKRLRDIAVLDIKLYENSKAVIPQDERMAFGEELLLALNEIYLEGTERLFDNYQGFDVCLPVNTGCQTPHVYIKSPNGGKYYLEMDTDKPLGCAMRIDHLLENLADRVTAFNERIERAEKNCANALEEIEKGNIYGKEVELLERELESIDRLLEQADRISV